MNLFATIWVGIITVWFCLPFVPAGVPGNKDFAWESVNYAPITVGVVVLGAWIGWLLWAKDNWPGHVREVDDGDVT